MVSFLATVGAVLFYASGLPELLHLLSCPVLWSASFVWGFLEVLWSSVFFDWPPWGFPSLTNFTFRLLTFIPVVILAYLNQTTGNEREKAAATSQKSLIVALPAVFMVLTHCFLVNNWWYAIVLGLMGLTWPQFVSSYHVPWKQPYRREPKPPDPDPPNLPKSRGYRATLLFGLAAAVRASYACAPLALSRYQRVLDRLPRHPTGFVMTENLSTRSAERVRKALSHVPTGFLADGDSTRLILDSGCSRFASGVKSDFTNLRRLPEPISMQGISGGLKIEYEGDYECEVLTDDNELMTLKVSGYFHESLGDVRLFSPRDYFTQIDSKDNDKFVLTRNKCYMEMADGSRISAHTDPGSRLPMLTVYKDAMKTAQTLAFNGCVTAAANQNLDWKSKLLLRVHFKLGHVNMSVCQWIGRQGILGNTGEKIGNTSLSHPKCATCQFGKQGKTPVQAKGKVNKEQGNLIKDTLKPGDLIFSDQYQSRVSGRAFTSRGLSSSKDKFEGGTLFYDAASGMIHVYHQYGFTAEETIQSKTRFENEALNCGVMVKQYHTDNGVYRSTEFLKELAEKGQGIRMSGSHAHHQNGAAENAIKIVVTRARTMMLHVALHWPEMHSQDLWPMALQHAVHLYNNTPTPEKRWAPVEFWTSTKSNYQHLLNAHVWGCPVYVLDPKLSNGHKLPKWDPRSRRGQYMGASPVHASTVGLVRNLQTGSITPQFHCVYDDFFETVYADANVQPPEWNDLIVTNRFRSAIDADADPGLTDEWLSPEELHDRRQRHQEARTGGRPVFTPRDSNPERPAQRELPPQEASEQREREPEPEVMVDTTLAADDPPLPVALEPPNPDPVLPSPAQNSSPEGILSRPRRTRRPPDRFGGDKLGHLSATTARAYGRVGMKRLCYALACSLVGASSRMQTTRHMLALHLNADYGTQEAFHPWWVNNPMAMKLKKVADPDLPMYHEAMAGPHSEEFTDAMQVEVSMLEQLKTWCWVRRETMEPHLTTLPTTWAMRIKRYPDGRMRKFKARLCVRGDKQVQGIHYDEKYAPVVQWSTVRMLLCLAAHQNLATKQIDFSNAFVQATLDKPLYLEPFKGIDRITMKTPMPNDGGDYVLKLNKSLYGSVDAPLYYYRFLREKLSNYGFTPSEHDPCLYIGPDGMLLCTYVDDCIFFHKDQRKIDDLIARMKTDMPLTVEDGEDNAYAFLGVTVKRHNNGDIELNQTGLIKKLLKVCGMEECNPKKTPAGTVPLGADRHGEPCQAPWDYASAVGMLMYLCSNSRPDIQFAVHQCARFTHQPKRSHELAILRICRYLKGTADRGLRFKPTRDLQLNMYVDADFAGLYNVESIDDPVSVKSRTGYVLELGGCPVIWVSRLQQEISLSTVESEYQALSQAMRDLVPARGLLKELVERGKLPCNMRSVVKSQVFEDNNGALSNALSPRISPRTKHIAVKVHWFKSKLGPDKADTESADSGGGIFLEKIDSEFQKADIFTKGLADEPFTRIRKLLMGW